ncbi:MAG: TIM barrel protein [Clostridia bacterium]|nr:TIM barrel protein [Clostridia bacterium]
MRFGACLNTLYLELPWLERFTAAARDGFDAVEFWDWRTLDLDATAAAIDRAGIALSGFNGDADYSPVDPTHKQAYLTDLRASLQAAKRLGASSVTIHSNALGEGGVVVRDYRELSHTVKLGAMLDTLKASAELAERFDVQLNLEALNTHVDHVGNFLASTQMSAEIVRLVGSPKLRILQDIYHMQINEGNLCANIAAAIDVIGHVHIADVPGRHEPGTGEIHYANVIKALARGGYTGIIGCELFPATDTAAAVRAIMALKQAAE